MPTTVTLKGPTAEATIELPPGSELVETESPDVLLERYATEARENHLDSELRAKQVQSGALEYLKARLLCGQALNAARDILKNKGKGQWLQWLEKEARITQPTAWRHMALANYSSVNNLTAEQMLAVSRNELFPSAPSTTERQARPLIAWFESNQSSFTAKIERAEKELTTPEEKQSFGKVLAEIHKITGEVCRKMGVELT